MNPHTKPETDTGGIPPHGAERTTAELATDLSPLSDVGAGRYPTPLDLGHRGARLWVQMVAGRTCDEAWLVMLHEAGRMVDRLDRMDRLLSGDIETWARIELPDLDGKPCVLIFDDALGESRQYVNTFRQLMTTLKVGVASEVTAEDELAQFKRSRARKAAKRAAGE